jgi:hypothetical protein
VIVVLSILAAIGVAALLFGVAFAIALRALLHALTGRNSWGK